MGDTTGGALKFGWLVARDAIHPNLGKNGESGVKEAPKLVWLGIRQSVWIPNKLILMSFVKISPLIPWEIPQELWNLACQL
jgi:hypothetical protein